MNFDLFVPLWFLSIWFLLISLDTSIYKLFSVSLFLSFPPLFSLFLNICFSLSLHTRVLLLAGMW